MKKSTASVGFTYTIKQIVDGVVVSSDTKHNLVPIEGLNYIMEAALRQGSQAPALYLGLFKGAYTPTPADTMADFVTSAVEQTNYVSTTRPVLTLSAADNGEMSNSGDKVRFVGNLAGQTVAGGFVSTSSVKGSTVGSLLSAVRFPSPKELAPGADIELTVVFNMVSI